MAFGYVILTDNQPTGICVGTEAEAEALCSRFQADYQKRQEFDYGELAAHIAPSRIWTVKKVPILL